MNCAQCLGCTLVVPLAVARAEWPDLIEVAPTMRAFDADHEGFCKKCFARIFPIDPQRTMFEP